MSGAEEDRKRAARAEQVALFRYQLIREAADPALSTRQRGRLVRELAGKAHPGPFGEPVTVSRETIDRWVRAWQAGGGFTSLAPPGPAGHPAHRRGGAGAGRRAEAGETWPHRRAGDADPAGQLRLVAVGAHAAAALRAAGADHPPGRSPPGGLRPVRGVPAVQGPCPLGDLGGWSRGPICARICPGTLSRRWYANKSGNIGHEGGAGRAAGPLAVRISRLICRRPTSAVSGEWEPAYPASRALHSGTGQPGHAGSGAGYGGQLEGASVDAARKVST